MKILFHFVVDFGSMCISILNGIDIHIEWISFVCYLYKRTCVHLNIRPFKVAIKCSPNEVNSVRLFKIEHDNQWIQNKQHNFQKQNFG